LAWSGSPGGEVASAASGCRTSSNCAVPHADLVGRRRSASSHRQTIAQGAAILSGSVSAGGCHGHASGTIRVLSWFSRDHALRPRRVVDRLMPTHGRPFTPHPHRSVGMAPNAATLWTNKPALAIEVGHTRW
jgi:hypothetical protein